jgi:release factor glutamine methyltransferase
VARTRGDAVRELQAILAGKPENGGNSAREPEWILAHACERSVGDILLRGSDQVDEAAFEAAAALAERRAAGEPLQYLLGEVDFLGRRFLCDPRALIPRPETETLVAAALEHIPVDRRATVAELGTGSGVVAVTLALERPLARVIATDISEAALGLARENARLWDLEGRVELALGDLTEPITEPVDVLVFNPPYVPSALVGALQRELAYEPRQALDGGSDGLDVFRRLAGAWRSVVRAGGWALVEVGAGQHLAVAETLGGSESRLWDDDRAIVRVVGVRA